MFCTSEIIGDKGSLSKCKATPHWVSLLRTRTGQYVKRREKNPASAGVAEASHASYQLVRVPRAPK